MKSFIKIVAAIFFCLSLGCSGDNKSPFKNNRLNEAWLNHIVGQSDSSYTKRYHRSDFVFASYYINHKDSSICQVMRDSSERVRQIIIEKGKVRTFYAQYYSNGQAMAIFSLGKNGRFEGEAKHFYLNGKIEKEGKYCDGLYCGQWIVYDDKGEVIRTEKYDENGNLLPNEN